MASCYILYSQKLNRFYTGITGDDVNRRIEKHNTNEYGNHHYTAKVDDWKLFLLIHAKDMSHARRIELKIKSMKSSIFIRNLKKYPELIRKVVDEIQ